MARIAVGGFHHETNTFAPSVATYDDFVAADAWPGLCTGYDIFEYTHGINLPVSGFSYTAKKLGHELIGLTWCAAPPSGPVSGQAFEAVMEQILSSLANGGNIDGVFMDLHGAMVSEEFEDSDGEILKRIRHAIGPDVPLVVALDFHANISTKMCQQVDGVLVYRTYPHVDMFETGQRCCVVLDNILNDGKKRFVKLAQSSFLVPLTWQCTLSEPAKDIYLKLGDMEASGIDCLSLAMGFPLADVFDCGPAGVVSGFDEVAVTNGANAVLELLEAHENDFAGTIYQPDDAIKLAEEINNKKPGPVILADTQDNPGGGGDGDSTGLLKAMIKSGAKNAVAGVFAEPGAVKMATTAGIGNSFKMDFGAKKSFPGDSPLRATFKVLALGSGKFKAGGPFFKGSHIDLGAMALLETAGIKIVVSAKKQQAADRAMFTHLGIDPQKCDLLVLKSSVHFRADFESMAAGILVVAAPGANTADPRELNYKNIRAGIKHYPGS